MKAINRRDAMLASAGAALSLVGIDTATASPPARTNKAPGNPVPFQGKLAGRTLRELHDQYQSDLYEDFLPFMEKHVIDHELGGFMCNANRDGSLISTKKNSWYIGRGIWVYSRLYNQLGRRPKHLRTARKATEFVLRDPPKGDGLWPAEYDKAGSPIEAKGQFIGGKYVAVGKQIYGDLFIANGLAEFAKASGQMQYWDQAKAILVKCARIYDRPDYDPSAPKVYLGGEGSELPGVRLLGVWMLMLRVGSQMLAEREDPEIMAIVDRSLDAIINHHYNPDYDLLNEVLNHDMSRPSNEYRDLVYTGHGIETMWMVLYEAQRRGDETLFKKASRLLRRHIEVSWDDVYGGLFRGVKNVDKNTWILDKALWVQEEALIGTLYVVEHSGEDWAKHWFGKIFTYVQDKYPLKKHGHPLWDHWPDRKVTYVEKYSRIENFHHPRHLMLNLLCLRRMMQPCKQKSARLRD